MGPTTEDVVRRAARWIHEGRRLDLVALAAELGVSRTTLHRRAGNREVLLGRALWHMAERAMRRVGAEIAADPGAEATGRPRTVAAITTFNRFVVASPALRRLLDDEPVTTVRVLTDSRGHVQPRLVSAVERLLRRDRGSGDDPPFARADQLAYALVRLSESFVYADVLADRTPDIDTADRLMLSLVESWLASDGTTSASRG